MLLNLSNHPLSKWSPEQRQAAEREYQSVVDLPFPPQDPAASLEQVGRTVRATADECERILSENAPGQRNAIHIMGEFTFTYLFVKEMERRGLPCVASTTERIVTDNPDGSKTTVFQFVQFRPYFNVQRTPNNAG